MKNLTFFFLYIVSCELFAQGGSILGESFAPLSSMGTFSNAQIITFTAGEPLRPDTELPTGTSSVLPGFIGTVGGILYVSIHAAPNNAQPVFQIFPNPFEQYINIIQNEYSIKAPVKAVLYDVNGKRIDVFPLNEIETKLYFTNLTDGIYILSFINKSEMLLPWTFKLVKVSP